MITVVTGPPCSGKSTWVRENAQPGDIVIDFDAIAQALGSPAEHDHDPQVREVTAAAWAAAVTRLTAGYPHARAWIIDSRPTRQRQQDYQRARARTVAMQATRGELHRRADADGRTAEQHQRIDAFLAGPQAARQDPAPRARTRW